MADHVVVEEYILRGVDILQNMSQAANVDEYVYAVSLSGKAGLDKSTQCS